MALDEAQGAHRHCVLLKARPSSVQINQTSPYIMFTMQTVDLALVVVGSLAAKSCPTLEAPWTVACKAPLSTGFSRQEHWRRLPFLTPGDLLDPGIKPASLALVSGFFTTVPPGKPMLENSHLI